MRGGCLLLIAACSGAPSRPAPSPAPSISTTPPAPPAPADQMLARVAYKNTNAWVDIAAEGTDARARQTCELLVERLRRQNVAPLEVVLERGCEAVQLPRTRPHGLVMLDRREADVVEALFLGLTEPLGPATITHGTWFADAAACERARTQLIALAERDHVEAVARVADFNASQVADAERRAKIDCDKLAQFTKERQCRGDAPCETMRNWLQRECTQAQERVAALREKQNEPEPPTPPPPPCVATDTLK